MKDKSVGVLWERGNCFITFTRLDREFLERRALRTFCDGDGRLLSGLQRSVKSGRGLLLVDPTKRQATA